MNQYFDAPVSTKLQETLPWWHSSRTMQTASSEANKPPRCGRIGIYPLKGGMSRLWRLWRLWIIHWHSGCPVSDVGAPLVNWCPFCAISVYFYPKHFAPRDVRCLRSQDDEKMRAADAPVRRWQWLAMHQVWKSLLLVQLQDLHEPPWFTQKSEHHNISQELRNPIFAAGSYALVLHSHISLSYPRASALSG